MVVCFRKKYKELFFPRKAGFPEVPVCGNQVINHVEKSEALDDTLGCQVVILTHKGFQKRLVLI